MQQFEFCVNFETGESCECLWEWDGEDWILIFTNCGPDSPDDPGGPGDPGDPGGPGDPVNPAKPSEDPEDDEEDDEEEEEEEEEETLPGKETEEKSFEELDPP